MVLIHVLQSYLVISSACSSKFNLLWSFFCCNKKKEDKNEGNIGDNIGINCKKKKIKSISKGKLMLAASIMTLIKQ